jgi:hypothetical protein
MPSSKYFTVRLPIVPILPFGQRVTFSTPKSLLPPSRTKADAGLSVIHMVSGGAPLRRAAQQVRVRELDIHSRGVRGSGATWGAGGEGGFLLEGGVRAKDAAAGGDTRVMCDVHVDWRCLRDWRYSCSRLAVST